MQAHLVSVATNAGHTLDPEVERLDREASLFQERHDEAAEAAIHMQAYFVLGGKFSEGDNVVLVPVREVDSRAHNLS